MRIHEITGTLAETTTAPETWEDRFANHQRQQSAKAKKVKKLADTQSRAADQARTAAAARARNHERIADAQRDLAAPPKS